MKKVTDRTATHETGRDDFLVDVVRRIDDKGDEVFEAWLYCRRMGMKMLMYRIPARVWSYRVFVNSVTDNLDEYCADYDEQVF